MTSQQSYSDSKSSEPSLSSISEHSSENLVSDTSSIMHSTASLSDKFWNVGPLEEEEEKVVDVRGFCNPTIKILDEHALVLEKRPVSSVSAPIYLLANGLDCRMSPFLQD